MRQLSPHLSYKRDDEWQRAYQNIHTRTPKNAHANYFPKNTNPPNDLTSQWMRIRDASACPAHNLQRVVLTQNTLKMLQDAIGRRFPIMGQSVSTNIWLASVHYLAIYCYASNLHWKLKWPPKSYTFILYASSHSLKFKMLLIATIPFLYTKISANTNLSTKKSNYICNIGLIFYCKLICSKIPILVKKFDVPSFPTYITNIYSITQFLQL